MKLTILFCSLFLSTVCLSQSNSSKKDWYVKAQAGYGLGIKLYTIQRIGEAPMLDNGNEDFSHAKYSPYFPGSGYQTSITIGKKITPVLGFELGLNYQNSSKSFSLKSQTMKNPQGVTQKTHYRGFVLVATPAIALRQSIKKIDFYVSMGISVGGGEFLRTEIFNGEVTNYFKQSRYVFGWHFGLGAEQIIYRDWSVYADIRLNNIFYHISHNVGMKNPHAHKNFKDEIPFSNIALNLGLMYHF